MNSTVRAALANGTFSAKNSRIDAKGIAGRVSLNLYSALSGEEIAALTAKFGADVVGACGLKANDKAAEKLASEKAAEAGSAQAAMAARTGNFAPKARDYEGGTLGANIRHGFGG